ncbi:hypothetical protein ACSCIG_002416, partial [Vibrio parahaemolyticus]
PDSLKKSSLKPSKAFRKNALLMTCSRKVVWLKLNESSTSAAGCGIVGGFHLEKYIEADGDKVLLVAIDSEANGDHMTNSTKVFDNEEEYDSL